MLSFYPPIDDNLAIIDVYDGTEFLGYLYKDIETKLWEFDLCTSSLEKKADLGYSRSYFDMEYSSDPTTDNEEGVVFRLTRDLEESKKQLESVLSE